MSVGDPARSALEERLRIARRDLDDLARQVEEGEIDEATADRLRDRYRQEVAEAEAQLAAAAAPAARGKRKQAPVESAAPIEGNARTILIGTLVALAVMTVAIVAIVVLARPDREPIAASDTTESTSMGDAIAQMEAAVAAQPQNNAMRLALADLYFSSGDYMSAMNHYSTILESNPTTAEFSEASTRIGWMAFDALNDPETAVEFLTNAIEADPVYGEAKLRLAVVLLYGMDDPEAAIPLLEEALTYPDLTPELRTDVETMLELARSGGVGQ